MTIREGDGSKENASTYRDSSVEAAAKAKLPTVGPMRKAAMVNFQKKVPMKKYNHLFRTTITKYLHRLCNLCNKGRQSHKMPGKRKFSDLNAQPAVHESRRVQVYGDKPKPAKKAKKIDFENRTPTSAVNDLKKHIRDLRRKLIRLQDLPADVRAENERALAAYEQELALAEQKKVRDACIKRWHMVRFFGELEKFWLVIWLNLCANWSESRETKSNKASEEIQEATFSS